MHTNGHVILTLALGLTYTFCTDVFNMMLENYCGKNGRLNYAIWGGESGGPWNYVLDGIQIPHANKFWVASGGAR